jgi:energy-coupling factor transporter ATP-binding protein EcfA2
MTALPLVGPPQMVEKDLSARLDALAELVKIGRLREGQDQGQDQGQDLPSRGADGFSKSLLDDSEALLRRAGERLRLSANHTVVALAGGTGSGKSTLFNALSGASFSPPGVTRPTTRHVHACVWGMQGAAPLLDWLGVQRRHRYARASALDSGEAALDGLLLLDLPDHDSVVTASMAAVDRLSKLADMLIWVLDPQKYADAAVHNRYLIPLAGHAGVFTVVLNQIDLLTPDQVVDCEDDLRRLLDAEGLGDTPLLPVSARTGVGVDELRALLIDVVGESHAAGDRIAADIDSVIAGYTVHAGPQVAPDDALASIAATVGRGLAVPVPADVSEPPQRPSRPPWELGDEEQQGIVPQKPPWEDATQDGGKRDAADPVANVPEGPAAELAEAFARAAGLTAVAESLANAREALAARFTGWPLAQLVRRRRDPVRSLRTAGRDRGGSAGGQPAATVAQAPQSEVDNAITAFADAVGGELPAPWAASLRDAARCNASMVPAALADAVHQAEHTRWQKPAGPGGRRVPVWWRLITAWQWLLTVLAVGAAGWAVVIAVAHGGHQKSTLLGDVSLIPWLLIMAAAMLLLGFLTASGCKNMVLLAAERERESAEQAMRERVVAVTRDLVLDATGREIGQYERFRVELAVAAGPHGTR